jgi:heme A synthase
MIETATGLMCSALVLLVFWRARKRRPIRLRRIGRTAHLRYQGVQGGLIG